MDKTTNFKAAFHKIVESLGPKKRASLAAEIALINQLVEPKANPVSTFWQDKERSAKTRKAMKEAGKARRAQLRISWRSTGEERIAEYQEIAELVGRALMTVRIAVSKGGGTAYFAHNDDIITVQRL